jgi:caffeoyl-CoA O-methyltransferase
MSDRSTPVDGSHFRYIAEHALPDDEFLRDLKRAALDEDIPTIHIAPEQASCMQAVLRIGKARDVVEVGTLAGYSAIRMARALPDEGRVRTIELDERHAEFAERWIARSDVAHKIEVLRGAGCDVLPGLDAESADATFIDADKAGYRNYLDESVRILRPGGFVMVDNALAYGQILEPGPVDPNVRFLREFNDHVAGRGDLEGVIIPLGDGLWICVKPLR